MLMTATPPAKPIPATIGLIFGGLWVAIGAFALPAAWRLPAIIIAAIVTSALLLRLWRRPAGSDSPAPLRKAPYRLAVVGEMVAIAAASALLPRLKIARMFVPFVGIGVGRHFIGLWRATGSRRFVAICVGMCGLSGIAIRAPEAAGEIVLHRRRRLGNALMLWLGANRSNKLPNDTAIDASGRGGRRPGDGAGDAPHALRNPSAKTGLCSRPPPPFRHRPRSRI